MKTVALTLILALVTMGCITTPATPEQRDAKIRIVERLIARVMDMTGGGDGAIQLWISDNPENARLALDGIATAIDVAILYGATSEHLRIPIGQFTRFVELFRNTTGEPYIILEPLTE